MGRRTLLLIALFLLAVGLLRCGEDPAKGPSCPGSDCEDAGLFAPADAEPRADSGIIDIDGSSDGSKTDASSADANQADAEPWLQPDASAPAPDGSTSPDASWAGADTGVPDSSEPAAGPDAGLPDADAPLAGLDAGSVDASGPAPRPDAGTLGPCISGASGPIAVRFAWAGSWSGSTAHVVYETNGLPDTSRWKAGAYSTSFSYTPTFEDIYLGEGGLALEGNNFMDVELSTLGLSTLRRVTLAIYGRSYNTTASGSFEWQTIQGMNAAPTDLVSNSAPYEWYAADATTEFAAGDDGVLLRIRPGPSSDALIVNRVELCFDAD
ncbi:MAG: hypothetical protein HY901_33225 [Deltaproteobacteria bacterium]|nr:hypothetical protein [Deltaproteobacteria bacterium]